MRFDWSSCAVGFIAGIGALLCVILATQLGIYDAQNLCDMEETAISCVRNWVNVVAVVAAAGTLFLLVREQSFAREIAIIQSVDLRTQMMAARRTTTRLKLLAGTLRGSAYRWSRSIEANSRLIRPRYMVENILAVVETVEDENWRRITDIDPTLHRKIARVLGAANDLLMTFLPDDLQYARVQPRSLSDAMISQHWAEDIEPKQIDTLSHWIDDVANEVDGLCEHLADFRASSWFREKRGDLRQ